MLEFLTMVAQHFGVSGNMSEYGGKVTLGGFLIVFAMLILLVFLIFIFGAVMQSVYGTKKIKKMVENKVESVKLQTITPAVEDSDDVIAAISAAVMMMYEGTGKTPIIRSIKPSVSCSRSAWKAAGVANNTRAF